MKNAILILLLLLVTKSFSQVGINNTNPKALLDITASNITAPSETDGILVPRINAFPATNPGPDQNAMIVYLMTTSGTNTPGFYYWDNGTTSWIPLGAGSTTVEDSDWFEEGTTTVPDAITDNIYTTGRVAVGHDTTDGGRMLVSSEFGDTRFTIEADRTGAFSTANPSFRLRRSFENATNFREARIDLEGSVSGEIVTGSNPNDMLFLSEFADTGFQFLPNAVPTLTINPSGQLSLDSYTTATSYTGTATSILAVDASGNIIQEALPTGGADTQDLSIDNTVADLSLVDGGTVEIKTIADSDDDTLIQVEESADEDVIRFDVEGNEHFTMNNRGQLQVYNSGTSVFLGEGAGAADDLSTNRNVLIGYEAGNDMTNSPNNTVIGWRAMDAATNGVDNNVSIGQSTFGSLTTGSTNVAIGVGALSTTATANNSVAIGANALSNAVASENNVAIGRSAGANSDGPDNVYIGYQADSFNANAGATQNVIIGSGTGEATGGATAYVGRVMLGYQAGRNSGINNSLFIENSSSVTPLLYGEFDNDILRIGGQLQIGSSDDTAAGAIYSFPTVDGTSGQALTTDGTGNVSWSTVGGSGADTQDLSIDNTVGDLSLVDGGTVEIKTIADSDDNTLIQVEESANEDRIRFDISGSEKLVINNKGHFEVLNTGGSVIIGEGTGTSDDGTDNENVFIGKNVAPNVSTGSTNAFDSDDNVGIAREALNSLTDGTNNIAVGRQALQTITTNQDNVAIGTGALQDLTAATVDNGNIAIGSGASANRISGGENTIIGYNAEVFRAATGNGNTGFGARTLQRMTDGDYNTVVGYNSGFILENGSYNTLLGRGTASGNTSGEVEPDMMASVIIGDQAGGIANFNNLFVLDNSIGTTPLLSGVFANDSAFGGGGIKDQGPYNDNRLGINIDYSGNAVNLTHTLTVGGSVKIQDVLNLEPGTAPTTPDEGDVYYDSALKKVRVFTGTVWENLN